VRVVVDLGRAPDDPGRRADIDHALRTLADCGMVEWADVGTRMRLVSDGD
jgi:hypothetical protein